MPLQLTFQYIYVTKRLICRTLVNIMYPYTAFCSENDAYFLLGAFQNTGMRTIYFCEENVFLYVFEW